MCAGDSISISGQTYTSNATRFDTLTASNLCDSIVFSNIEFIAPSVGYQTFVICSGDSVQVMNSTYYSSGTYIDTVYQIGYCDSLVSTEVIVLPSTPVNIFATGLNTNVICLGDTILLQHLDSYHITGTRLQTLLVYYPHILMFQTKRLLIH